MSYPIKRLESLSVRIRELLDDYRTGDIINIMGRAGIEVLPKIQSTLAEIDVLLDQEDESIANHVRPILDQTQRWALHPTNPLGYNELSSLLMRLKGQLTILIGPKLEKEIDNLISRLLTEDDEKYWRIIVVEIVKRIGSKAIDNILQAIKNDKLTEPDKFEISISCNSSKWNSLAITYLDNNFLKDSVKIFEELLKREPNNAGTQNNYGVALHRMGLNDKAKEFFQKAYGNDKKRGLEEAKKLSAYRNLKIFENKEPRRGDTVAITSPSYHNILFMDIVGFSRSIWSATIQVEKLNFLIKSTRRVLKNLEFDYMKIPTLPTGDGMALFFDHLEHPIEFVKRLTEKLNEYNEKQESNLKLELRIGIHAGDSFYVEDLHHRPNRCSPAINKACRVMGFGENGHILCSYDYGKRLIDMYGLEHYGSILHNCGIRKAKHDEEIGIYNIYNSSFGNPNDPPKRCRAS